MVEQGHPDPGSGSRVCFATLGSYSISKFMSRRAASLPLLSESSGVHGWYFSLLRR